MKVSISTFHLIHYFQVCNDQKKHIKFNLIIIFTIGNLSVDVGSLPIIKILTFKIITVKDILKFEYSLLYFEV